MAARGLVIPSAPATKAADERPTHSAPNAHGAGRAIVVQLISWGMTIPTGLLITGLLAHYLGTAQYGEYSFVVPLLTIFGLVGGIGMDPLVIRRLSRETRGQWADTLSYAAGTRLASTSVAALSVVAVALLFPFSADERALLLIGSASLLFGFQVGSMRSIYDNAYRAEQRVLVPSVLLMADRLLTAGLVALAIVLHLSLLWIYFLIVYSDLPFFVAMIVISRRRFGVRLRFSLSQMRDHIRTGLPLVSYDALVQVAWRADLFLLMALAGPVSVGVYALALRVTDPLFAIVMAYVSGLYPLLCSTFEQGRLQFQRSYHEAARLLALGTIPLAVFISVEAGPIVSILGGRHFAPAVPALVLLMWATAVGFLGQLEVRTCMSANLERTIPYVMGAAAGVNVLASLALIPHWHSTGAAAGALFSVIAEVGLFIILLASRAQVLPPSGALLRVVVGNLPGLAFLLWLRHAPLWLTAPAYVLIVLAGCLLTRSLSRADIASARSMLLSRRGHRAPPTVDLDAREAPVPSPPPPESEFRRRWSALLAFVRRAYGFAANTIRVRLAPWRATTRRVQYWLTDKASDPDRRWLRSLLSAYDTLARNMTRWRAEGEVHAFRIARALDDGVSQVATRWLSRRRPAQPGPARPTVATNAEPRANLQVSLARGTDAIATLADEWSALLDRASRPTVFQSPEWLATWCRHLGNGQPWLLPVRAEDGTLVGIVPLQLQRLGIGPFRLRVLRWLGYGKGALTDSLGPVFATGFESAGMHAALTHLVHEVPGWAMLDLDRNRDDLVDAVRQWSPNSGCRLEVFKSAGWLYIRLPGDWSTLQSTLSKNLRSNLPRYRNRLRREGHTQTVTVLTDPEAVAAALPRFLDLHASRAQASELKYHSNYFGAPASRAFVLEIARTLSQQGRLALAQMDVDGTIVAAQLLLFQGQMMTSYFSGFDPEWSRYSVMLLTQKACIEYAIAHGMKWVDLTAGAGGEDQTKRQWGNEETLTKHIMLTRTTVTGTLTNWVLQKWYIMRRLQMWRHQSHRRPFRYMLSLPQADQDTAPAVSAALDLGDSAAEAVYPEEIGRPTS